MSTCYAPAHDFIQPIRGYSFRRNIHSHIICIHSHPTHTHNRETVTLWKYLSLLKATWNICTHITDENERTEKNSDTTTTKNPLHAYQRHSHQWSHTIDPTRECNVRTGNDSCVVMKRLAAVLHRGNSTAHDLRLMFAYYKCRPAHYICIGIRRISLHQCAL